MVEGKGDSPFVSFRVDFRGNGTVDFISKDFNLFNVESELAFIEFKQFVWDILLHLRKYEQSVSQIKFVRKWPSVGVGDVAIPRGMGGAGNQLILDGTYASVKKPGEF